MSKKKKKHRTSLFKGLKPIVPFVLPYWKLVLVVAAVATLSALNFTMRGVMAIPIVNLVFPEETSTTEVIDGEVGVGSVEDEGSVPGDLVELPGEVGFGEGLISKIPMGKELLELFTEKAKVGGYSPMQVVLLVCVLAAFVTFVGAVSRFVHVSLSHYVRSRVVIDLRTKVYARICRFPISYFDKERSGELMSRLTNDLVTTHRALEYLFGDLFEHPFRILVGSIALFAMSWKLTLISFFVGIFVILPLVKIGGRIRRTARKRQEKAADLTDQMAQTFSGIRVVKAFSMEDTEANRFREENLDYLGREMKVVRGKALSRATMELYGGISVPILLFAAFFLMTNQGGDRAVLVAYLVVAGQLYQPLKVLSRAYTVLQDSIAGMDRVFEVMAEDVAEEDREGAKDLQGLNNEIVFDDVSFSYDGVTPILQNVSFKAKAGEMVAIVGPSGAGKTTLLDLLVRFYEPNQGAIHMDGIDIRDITRSSLMKNIAMVTQDPFLFNAPIGENIRYGRPDASKEDVLSAARAAHVEDFVSAFPEGYDSMVGERGVMLSGGQKQRITISRALLKNAPILILDEATSNLDSESEKLIQKALPELVKGRTTFVIAHRFSTVRAADRIVVMNEGTVAETGSHDELISRSGLYRHLHELQFS